MRPELVVATKNRKKLEEIKEILTDLSLKIYSLNELHNLPRIIEDGKTFRENAIKKAVKTAKFTKKLTLGEDSGLEVFILDGKPGIYSAIFAGKNKNDLRNNLKLLKLLNGIPFYKRRARYICSIALADKDRVLGVTEGKCSGLIGFELKGDSGFGYDPLFIPNKYRKTFAEIGPKIKNKMSHRYRALNKVKKIIKNYFKKRSD